MWSMILNYAAEFYKYIDIVFTYRDPNKYNIMESGDFHLIG